MLRKRAIRSLLVEEVAGLRTATPTATAEREAGAEPAEPPDTFDRALEQEALERAERRSLFAVGLDWLALVGLFLLRDPAAPFLPAGPTVDTVFTLGVVAVAVHSGFRLGQLEKYRAVRRAWDDLTD